MRNAFLIAWREFVESAKTRGFWIGMCLFPTIIFLSVQVPVWLEKKGTPVHHFVLVDQSGGLGPTLEPALEKLHQRELLQALNDYARKYALPAPGTAAITNHDPLVEFGNAGSRAVESFMGKGGQAYYLDCLRGRLKAEAPPFAAPRRQFQQVPLPLSVDDRTEVESLVELLKPYLRGEKKVLWQGRSVNLAEAILIPRDVESQIVRPQSPQPKGGPGIQCWSVNSADNRLRQEVERVVNSEVRRREYLARGLDLAVVRQVEQTYVPFASLNPKKDRGQEQVDSTDVIRQWAPSAFVYFLWVAIFSIVQMLLHNTIEEKSNRIIEVLLSSVTPGELMMGKLMGIAAIGLSMVGGWIIAMVSILAWKSGGAPGVAGQVLVVLKSSSLLPLFSLYFILGYLLYAAMVLSLGSVCNTLKEAQSYMSVITMLMMIPLLTMTFIPKDPNGTVARVLSWIPLYTPFTMMNRASADPPLVDKVGTLVLLVATTALALWMSGKIFRIGVLRTGQPPKLIEMARWALGR